MNTPSTSELAKENNRKRFNKSVLIWVLSLGSGLVAGISLAIAQKNNVNISNNFIIVIATIFSIFLFVLTWVWYKSMDEFEQASFNKAGNLSFHTGFIAIPWYFLSELGIFPKLEAFWLMVAMSFVFLAYYYGKKFL